MPGQPVDVGTGASIVFGTSEFTAMIHTEQVRLSGLTRNSFPTSHLGTLPPAAGKLGNATFIPGRLIDPGSMTLDIQFTPQVRPPIHGDPELITVTFPKAPTDITPAYWSCMGFLTAYSDITVPTDALMMATVTVKFSGEMTMVLAA